ncbi:peroxiredoxin [Schaalia sp. lx-100]|uniref:peroxiredoxin n=1 Tax=Schaalia sp. lx-100 TaxID=2899081 RepID=UPI001E4552E0|nr:peroxiredoxin [Schaalia sp. lx-100]MCD4557962.1 peroxiredoxin [Schaalia sp. lx-100]
MSTHDMVVNNPVALGEQAPDFTLDSTQGPVTLSDLVSRAPKGVVVYFYPKAATPGCTKEACDFRDSLNTFASAGYLVVGVSPDGIPALERFAQNEGLNFPLASDPDKAVMERWGAWGEKKNYGRVVTGTIRSTFVVDPAGVVVLAQRGVKATGHVARLRRDLGIDSQ